MSSSSSRDFYVHIITFVTYCAWRSAQDGRLESGLASPKHFPSDGWSQDFSKPGVTGREKNRELQENRARAGKDQPLEREEGPAKIQKPRSCSSEERAQSRPLWNNPTLHGADPEP